MTLIWQQIRQLLFVLDNVVYSLISKVYELFMYVANINLITKNPVLEGIISRIYLILGIFMLFKVSFSILHYIVDPNAFSDKAKGFGKLITNTLVSVILLVTIPWLFEQAYKLQEMIINNNVIPKLIIGDSGMTSFDSTTEGIQSTAKDVQFALFSAFYTINYSADAGIPACEPKPEDGKYTTNVIGSADMVNSGCLDAFLDDQSSRTGNAELNRYGGYLQDYFKYQSATTTTGKSCPNNVCDERDFGSFAKLLWWKKDEASDTDFVINYTPIISTIAGGWLLLILITFSIDLAARIFKLMFLQATAPIAIISYIDPKESASQSKLRSWINEFAKTYLSLFLRLAIIFLAIQLVKMLTNMLLPILPWNGDTDVELFYGAAKPEGTMHMFVYVILILGIFTFAKQVPGMIERIFNIKSSGELSLNPFKAISENPLTGGVAAGMIGGAAGTWAGVRAGAEAGAPLRGAIVGGIRGVSGGMNQGLKSGVFGSTRSKTYKEMTGNDLKTFNPAQSLLKPGSKAKIDKVSDPLKQAKTQKGTYEEKLKRAQIANNEAHKLFNKNNVDTSGFIKSDGKTDGAAVDTQKALWQQKQADAAHEIQVAEARKQAAVKLRDNAMNKRTVAMNSQENLDSKMNQLNNQIAAAKVSRNQISGTKERNAMDAQIKNWEKELNSVQAAKAKTQQDILAANARIEQTNSTIAAEDAKIAHNRDLESECDSIIKALSNYEHNREEELEISEEIRKIDKDIKILESEKNQRQQFYGVEESSAQSVDTAMTNVSTREQKLGTKL